MKGFGIVRRLRRLVDRTRPSSARRLEGALRSIETRRGQLAAADIEELLRATRPAPIGDEIAAIKNALSMLHTDVLILLSHFASIVEGGVLEFGPYIGGSTVAIGKGLQRSNKDVPFVTVEAGGQHAHNSLPSTDIVGDLRKNLALYGLKDRVEILVGFSCEGHVLESVRRTFAKDGIGLWVIDADGMVGRDFDNCLSLCRPGCFVVVDDYLSTQAPEKSEITPSAVEAQVAAGRIRPLGIYGWGTWIGQVV
jgi:predicted O-methyltransferase YrrM